MSVHDLRKRQQIDLPVSAALLLLSFGITLFAAWMTHVIWIIKTLASATGATNGQIALGVIGAFMPPVGTIHGFMIWLGLGF